MVILITNGVFFSARADFRNNGMAWKSGDWWLTCIITGQLRVLACCPTSAFHLQLIDGIASTSR